MDRGAIDFTSQRRNLDVPSKPESGLAEWTSKIKELQRQVDADEEEETKRLEQEIAASRLARMRRTNTDVAAALKETTPTVADESRSPDERRRNQDDALQKLSNDGANRGLADYNSFVASKSMKASSAAPMSLAAFMGGKASGPRLNKHAPQQDTHDPTQFEQRTFKGPHPIFGRGGVAMPGMVARSHGSVPQSREETSSPRTPDGHGQNAVSPTDTFKVRSVVEKAAPQRPVATTQFGVIRNEPPRQRTFSTPAGPVLSSATRPSHSPSFNSSKSEQNSPRPPSHSPSPILKGTSRPATPKETSSVANHVFPTRSNNVSPHPRSPVIRSPSPPKTPTLGSPGLAKPIQPSPRKSLQGPQIPISPNPSPVFLRPPPAKEPTPSISRLQGRGFVQSMVRASSQMDTGAGVGSPSSADKGREVTKKASVLDRWHHGNEAAPVIAPKPVPLRKVRTMDSTTQSSSTSSAPVQVFPTYTPPPPKPEKPEFASVTLKSRASLPLIQQERQSPPQKSDGGIESPTPSQRRALGSSTTMVSYIKPIKTGEGSSAVSPPSRPPSSASRGRPTTPAVDELGVRVRSRTRSIGGDSGHRSGTPGAGAGGKPLTHPTKSRPHKPRKAKTVLSGNQSASTEHRAQADRANTDDQVVYAATITQEKPASSPQEIGSKVAARTVLDDEKVSSVSESPPTPGASRRVHFPLPVEIPPPQPVHHAERSPATPIKHSRIPSTGNRATVMDVAQVFNEHQQFTQSEPLHSPLISTQIQSTLSSTSPDEEDGSAHRSDVKSMVASWGAQNGNDAPTLSADKRKSSYEKYSGFTLPPLAEEKTPVPSPAGTLARNSIPPSLDTLPEPVESSQSSGLHTKSERPVKITSLDSYVHFNIVDAPLPIVDVDSLIMENSSYTADPELQTISVEVVSIVGAAAAPINRDMNVFYDSETLAIVHRFKVKSSGLVSTKVWSWLGTKSQMSEKEERKLQDLARRYNTTLVSCFMLCIDCSLISRKDNY
ncbi:hypothetical protein EIP86_001343 [Pleurotus ostreatoroseus]|nr:hypothetical protein EIP86_001343 [Pleurotus ostreatoroseus]